MMGNGCPCIWHRLVTFSNRDARLWGFARLKITRRETTSLLASLYCIKPEWSSTTSTHSKNGYCPINFLFCRSATTAPATKLWQAIIHNPFSVPASPSQLCPHHSRHIQATAFWLSSVKFPSAIPLIPPASTPNPRHGTVPGTAPIPATVTTPGSVPASVSSGSA